MRFSKGCLRAAGVLFFFAGGLFAEEVVPLRINAGGDAVDGWVSDAGFVTEGAPFSFGGPHRLEGLKDPAPGKVYETVRHRDHHYRIPLAKGKYRLRFHFIDGYDSRKRKMDYVVEDVRVISEFTPVTAAGGVNRPVIVEVVTEVLDGNLDIICAEGRGDDVFEAGIEILAAGAGDAVTPGPAVVVPKEMEANANPVDVTEAIRNLAGAPVRLVWLQGAEAVHYTTSESEVKLMVLDTEDGKGARELIAGEGAYSKPVITPGGEGIVFTDRKERDVLFVPWSGGEVRNLGKGFAAEVWREPGTGVDWVYLRNGSGKEDPIVRRRLDDPSLEEGIWDRTQNGHDGVPWFQLSADGLRFSDAFPWSACGVGVLGKPGGDGKNWKKYGDGCWPGMAPDNSYRFWYFNGSHTDVIFFEANAKGKRKIPVNLMAGMNGRKVYYPRWSNDVRFITVAGPENDRQSQLYLGKFNGDFTMIERWVQVTDSGRADIFGDAWISPEGAAVAGVEKADGGTPEVLESSGGVRAGWPGRDEGLVFLWDDLRANNEIPMGNGAFAVCKVNLHGGAVPGRGFGMDVRGGWAAVDAGRADYVLEQCQGTGAFSVEALVTTAGLKQGGPARIFSFSNGTTERNFTLGQEGDRLVFRLRTEEGTPNGSEFAFGELQTGMAQHVLVSYGAQRVKCYINGVKVLEKKVGGDLSAWKRMPLVFGDESGGGRNWDGHLEAVAIWSRAVGDAEAADLATRSWVRLARRELPVRAVAEAELVEVTATPTAGEMGSYRRALVENIYAVKEVGFGELPEKIVVVEWAVLDGAPVAEKKEVGKVYRLVLEPYGDRPELEGEFKSVGHLEIDTPRYYRVGR